MGRIEEPMSISYANTCLLIVLGMAAFTDICWRRIPNQLTYPAMLAGISYHVLQNGAAGFLFSLCGILVGMGLLMLLFVTGGMGAGDVKLLGVMGAFLGAQAVVVATLYAAIIGGIYAVILLVVHRSAARLLIARLVTSLKTYYYTGKFIPIPASPGERKLTLCYGVAIALGGFLYMICESHGYNLPIMG
jgi:prepilin peptidase CpaA